MSAVRRLIAASSLAAAFVICTQAEAADVRERYGRYYGPPPAPEVEVSETEEVEVERRLPPPPPIARAPVEAGPCRFIVRRRVNDFGEVVIRRIRICDEVVAGPPPAPRWPGELRRDVYRPAAPPVPPRPVPGWPDEDVEEGEPG